MDSIKLFRKYWLVILISSVLIHTLPGFILENKTHRIFCADVSRIHGIFPKLFVFVISYWSAMFKTKVRR